MKLLLSLIVLLFSIISCIYSQSSSSSSSSSSQSSQSVDSSTDSSSTYKFVKTEMYPNGNGECTGDLVTAAYLLTGICGFEGISRVVCLEDGTIENIIYTEFGCTGEIKERIHVTPNNCTNAEQYSCVEELTIPENSYQIYYTLGGACPDTDPNWKSELYQVAYILTDTCMNSSTGANMITCNSTTGTPMEYIFNSTDSCTTADNNWTGYEYLVLPECSTKDSFFSTCGSSSINF